MFTSVVGLSTLSQITTIAGTGAGSSDGDGDLATLSTVYKPAGLWIDPIGFIYITELSGHKVRKIDPNSGHISLFVGDGVATSTTLPNGDGGQATAAAMNGPGGKMPFSLAECCHYILIKC
jgi:hypothetical protein